MGTDEFCNFTELNSFIFFAAMEGTCMELALEGERLCKAGDCRAGVQFFEAGIQVSIKTSSKSYRLLLFFRHRFNRLDRSL